MAFSSTCGARFFRALWVLLFCFIFFAACGTPLSASLTSPLTGATYSQNLRNGSTSNKLSLSTASGISTTRSFYSAYACKNWVLASGELAPQATERWLHVAYKSPFRLLRSHPPSREGTSCNVLNPSFCNAYYTFHPKFAAGRLPICGLRLKPALYDVKRCFL